MLAIAASCAAEPVPETGKVSALLVPYIRRRRALTSSMMARNCESRCPTVGRDSASRIRAETGEGPGPSKSRGSIGNKLIRFLVG